ncbi:hypothetical protein [Roseibacillus ishigakijimensis]|uniref:Uncharacterized protein n=1 Tax=Roseibacillus ishigakijimensis TaxID=454146 RepID=A0A934RPN4_9BACT|nr:hypothetical protein [Roseibacillus ishigakijimensis]MBK1833188.1 hypothetical protein [Roseibacillus ishigakijimensis]
MTPPALPPRAKVHTKSLWIAYLLPIVVTALLSLWAAIEKNPDLAFSALGSGAFAILVGWILLLVTLRKKVSGGMLALGLIIYPIAEATLCFIIFFAGCLGSLGDEGFGHRPPDDWVRQQEERKARETESPGETTADEDEGFLGTGRDLTPAGEPLPAPAEQP